MEKIFSKEHEKWIRENAEGIRNEKLTEMFNKQFNMNLAVGQIKKFKNFHHISSGLKSCNLPVGSERVNKGYIYVKVAEPNVWIEKHRLIYESMYGNIPTGHKVIFADKNKRNFAADYVARASTYKTDVRSSCGDTLCRDRMFLLQQRFPLRVQGELLR